MAKAFDFPVPPVAMIPVAGHAGSYPVRRVFCVGRNYAAHAAEMGFAVDREAPFYFSKSPSAITLSGATVPYPPGTANCHHELEFVVAIGTPLFKAYPDEAESAIFGYATGLDMTRRDLQIAARDKGRPWDLGKDFENSAIIGPITPAAMFGPVANQEIVLKVNGQIRQAARLSEMVWKVPELLVHLSGFYHLGPGDLLYTGTPSGVGPVEPGDRLMGTIEGLEPVVLEIAGAQE